ncbi:hypothetical protein [Arthrobacter sp. H16F315]|uniref:hypothetical protein n=1 Tax=Arthrobacter sp. H16F315 TaxID=2955314 RepID=UPI002098314A|nr:hypothetical protein [Arthrobacter sp. H16F315]MDD1477069.1 hypothetical protein [Arthrobacter sp. H16F315]
MNEVVAIIAAIVGSSGLASILAGGTQFRRTTRLHAQIKELDAAKNLLPDETRERAALEASTATVALELAAYVLVKADTRRLILLGLVGTSFIGANLMVFGYLPENSVTSLVLFPLPVPADANMPLIITGIVVLMSGYVAFYVYIYLRITARRRAKLIRRLLREPAAISSVQVLRVSREMSDPAVDSRREQASETSVAALPAESAGVAPEATPVA